MKSTKISARIAAVVAVLVTTGFAATTPALEFPRGLAVDSKGNLYVANSGGNNILVYGSGYVLQKSKTITSGISTPWGVAFDPIGDLWPRNPTDPRITSRTHSTFPPGWPPIVRAVAFTSPVASAIRSTCTT